jgi:DNA-binding transcriptional MerR regulator
MLRYVERVGLVEATRSRGGYRLYGPQQLQRLRTLRELLSTFDIGLSDVGFAARMRHDQQLRRAVDEWLDTTARRPAQVAADDWLAWEQDKHRRLLEDIESSAQSSRSASRSARLLTAEGAFGPQDNKEIA